MVLGPPTFLRLDGGGRGAPSLLRRSGLDGDPECRPSSSPEPGRQLAPAGRRFVSARSPEGVSPSAPRLGGDGSVLPSPHPQVSAAARAPAGPGPRSRLSSWEPLVPRRRRSWMGYLVLKAARKAARARELCVWPRTARKSDEKGTTSPRSHFLILRRWWLIRDRRGCLRDVSCIRPHFSFFEGFVCSRSDRWKSRPRRALQLGEENQSGGTELEPCAVAST